MGKVIITGPGRSGTTFLMQMLTRLGHDTGDIPYKERVKKEWRAGIEYNKIDLSKTDKAVRKAFKKSPRILKTPDLSIYLKDIIKSGLVEIDSVIMPIRDVEQSAKSRVDVGLYWLSANKTVEDQEAIHYWSIGKVVEACLLFQVPLTVMRFPEIVKEPDYLLEKLRQPFPDINEKEFYKVFKKTAKPEMIRTK